MKLPTNIHPSAYSMCNNTKNSKLLLFLLVVSIGQQLTTLTIKHVIVLGQENAAVASNSGIIGDITVDGDGDGDDDDRKEINLERIFLAPTSHSIKPLFHLPSTAPLQLSTATSGELKKFSTSRHFGRLRQRRTRRLESGDSSRNNKAHSSQIDNSQSDEESKGGNVKKLVGSTKKTVGKKTSNKQVLQHPIRELIDSFTSSTNHYYYDGNNNHNDNHNNNDNNSVDRKKFAIDLLMMLNDQYNVNDNDDVGDFSKHDNNNNQSETRQSNTPVAQQAQEITTGGQNNTQSHQRLWSLNQLTNALNADGDFTRFIQWIRSMFNVATVGEMATQLVVSKLGLVNCAAILRPDEEWTLMPRFLLFNKHYVDVPFELSLKSTPNDIEESRFDPDRKTIILLHGYLGGYTIIDGITNIKNRIVDASDPAYNVIIVDWFKGANPYPRSHYIRAAVNAQAVGRLIARFLVLLIRQGHAQAVDMHILAHSLGCHVAGFAAKAMQTYGHKLGKVTHLDPIGLCFGKLFSQPNYRLHPEDAFETDAVHVSLNLFDNPLDGAQNNFLVNGGRDQIGCQGESEVKNSTTSSLSLLWDNEGKFVPCSHVRALALYEDDMGKTCQIVGYPCPSYEQFLQGRCGNCGPNNEHCRLMSLPAQNTKLGTSSTVNKIRTTYDEEKKGDDEDNNNENQNRNRDRNRNKNQNIYTTHASVAPQISTVYRDYVTTNPTQAAKNLDHHHWTQSPRNYTKDYTKASTPNSDEVLSNASYDDDNTTINNSNNDTSSEQLSDEVPKPVKQMVSGNSLSYLGRRKKENKLHYYGLQQVAMTDPVAVRVLALPGTSAQLSEQDLQNIQKVAQQTLASVKVFDEKHHIRTGDKTITAVAVAESIRRLKKRQSDSGQLEEHSNDNNTTPMAQHEDRGLDLVSTESSSDHQFSESDLESVGQYIGAPSRDKMTLWPSIRSSSNENDRLVTIKLLDSIQDLIKSDRYKWQINLSTVQSKLNPHVVASLMSYMPNVMIGSGNDYAFNAPMKSPSMQEHPPVNQVDAFPSKPLMFGQPSQGRIYYVGTGPISSYCVNYYQFKIYISAKVLSELQQRTKKKMMPVFRDGTHETRKGQTQQMFSGNSNDKLHLTVKTVDSLGRFFKGFTFVENMRTVIERASSIVQETSSNATYTSPLGSNQHVVLTMLLNSTKHDPVKISESVISYYFHQIIIVDTIEINYMSNFSPE